MSNDAYITCALCNGNGMNFTARADTIEECEILIREHEQQVHNYMTGQEWLSRFQTELAADQPLHDSEHYQYLSKHALAIAKRAANIGGSD